MSSCEIIRPSLHTPCKSQSQFMPTAMEDYILKSSRTQYLSSGSNFETATLKKTAIRYDLITFLGVAQKLGIDFLPITWQSALDRIGRGATAEIREASMSLRANFAFKRPVFRSSFDSSEFESRIIPSLIAEMSILAQLSIRRHSNILQLEGICWDVLPGEGEPISRDNPIKAGNGGIVPVLVFEKANHGDLSSFMMDGVGKQLGFTERLKMCTSIAKAIAAMHSINIIHGDIKPQNTLIFNDISGGHTAKVADFGYSTQYALPDDLIYLPRSWPWAAPEWHHRGFTPAQAMRMDAYSFGMLVLWLLFYGTQEDSDIEFVRGLRSTSGALALAHQLIQFESQPQNIKLLRFFNATLTDDVASRCPDFGYLLCLLASEEVVSITRTEPVFDSLDLTRIHFQIVPSMYQFYQNDYRVRLYVADCFLRSMSELEDQQGHTLRSQNILLQCAICYKFGFGTTRDILRSHEIYEKFKPYETELQREFVSFHSARHSLRSESLYQSMLAKGHIYMIDLPEIYRGEVSLDKLELEHRKEIADVECALGHDHGIVIALKEGLFSILARHGQWDKAEQLILQIVEIRKRLLGEKHLSTLKSMSDLAMVYRSQDRYEEARELETHVTEERKSVLGAEDPMTLQSMMDLIWSYGDKSHLDEAEQLQMKIIETHTRVLGQEHLRTLVSLYDLADVYSKQKRWTEAEELVKRVIGAERRVLGHEHPYTLSSARFLIDLYRLQGRWEDAEELDLETLKTDNKVFEKIDPMFLIGLGSLASVYRSQNRWKDCETIEMQIIETWKEVLGEEHVDTLNSIGALASTYKEQERWKEAEELDLYVVDAQRRTLGDEHPDTLCSMMNLAVTYRRQRMWKETEELDQQIIETRKRVLGDGHPDTLQSMSNLAVTYYDQGRWRESLDLEKQVMETSKRALGEEHPFTLSSMATVAVSYSFHSLTSKGIALMRVVAQRRLETLGSDHPDTVDAREVLEAWMDDVHDNGDSTL